MYIVVKRILENGNIVATYVPTIGALKDLLYESKDDFMRAKYEIEQLGRAPNIVGTVTHGG